MRAQQLIERLLALPAAARIPASAPLEEIVLISGIEIASAPPGSERNLRRAWRDRNSGGATPLLVVADDPAREGCLQALGPLDADGALRTIESAALTEVLERVSSKPRLEAIRDLSAELERLDQAGIPGLKLNGLLTEHTLDVRLRRDALRWNALSETVKGIDRGTEWRDVLIKMGYELERRSDRGYLLRFDTRPIAVIHPKADPADFSRLDQEGRPAEGSLINDCLAEGASFGILASGGRLRLFESDPVIGSAAAQYLDLDTSSLQTDDFPLIGLFGPAYLVEDEWDRLRNEARRFGTGLRKRLDETIRSSALPALAMAFQRWARDQGKDLGQDIVRQELQQGSLTFIFRALFILYAESSGYLPMDNRTYRRASLTELVREASETRPSLGANSSSLWDRFQLLVKAMRNGNPAWGVPAYNGALFASDGFEGAETLERVEISDPELATVLVGIGRDPETGDGVDYSTLEIGHLGHIYEGLLSLNLSIAVQPLVYDPRRDTYSPSQAEDEAEVQTGDLLWQTHEGGRKSGGVYYTRSELVRHLVRQTVVPAFANHLEEIRALAETDPARAAEKLFDFSVLDPACGSAHFLVTVVNELADMAVRFLSETPLPAIGASLERLRAGAGPGVVIDDVALIRRLVMKRCVYGVDVSPMGAEVAKISLWLGSFVPGLSLAYLDRNIIVGNSLIGVADPRSLRPPGAEMQAWFLEEILERRIEEAAEAVARVAASEDRNPDEVAVSQEEDAAARATTESLETLFDLWTAEPLGLDGARTEVANFASEILDGRKNELTDHAGELAKEHSLLHWPLAFPQLFAGDGRGFNAVVGNPPWEEVRVEELGFYALFRPGLEALPETKRLQILEDLKKARPELPLAFAAATQRYQQHRHYFSRAGEFLNLPGDPDLYKFFCQRYTQLLRIGGALGVVLPRTAFTNLGSEDFRTWLFEENTCERIDFLLNSGRWAFDAEPRYTVALVSAIRNNPSDEHVVTMAGTATSLDGWEVQVLSPGLALPKSAFGPGWTTPLARSQDEVDLLVKLRQGTPFAHGGTRWSCFPVRELEEGFRQLWQGASEGWPLWKGESFDQYHPHGAESRICPTTEAVMKKVLKPRPGSESALRAETTVKQRVDSVRREVGRARVAFRRITRATDSRTIRACLVPPEVFLAESAPYLAFVRGADMERAACLGVMNSLPFDWQARRYIEINLNYFILEGLVVPQLDEETFLSVATAAAKLSCVDERYQEFADSIGIEVVELDDAQKQSLTIEIDARVAHGWGLSCDDVQLMLADFTLDAVTQNYRDQLLDRLSELS